MIHHTNMYQMPCLHPNDVFFNKGKVIDQVEPDIHQRFEKNMLLNDGLEVSFLQKP